MKQSHTLSILIGLGGMVLLLSGCSGEVPSSDVAEGEPDYVAPKSDDTALDAKTDDVSVGVPGAGLMGADETACCEHPGAHDECWWTDAEEDGVTCTVDGDCTGAETCHKEGTATVGLCTCASEGCGPDGQCVDYTLSADYETGDPTRVCAPSYCNGYFVCSCLGGCTWWDGKNRDNTPADNAVKVGLHCCEGGYGIDGGLGFFGDASCGSGVTDTDACDSDVDCDDGNQCTVNECKDVTGDGVKMCHSTVTTGSECDADGLACTIDRCQSDGSCLAAVAPRCPADTYLDSGGVASPNTCTEDCVEDPTDADGDGNYFTCYVPLSVPSDTAVKPSTPACDYWTCVPAGSTVEPQNVVVECSALDSVCNAYGCDPAGVQDNCDVVTMNIGAGCTPSDPADLCIYAECQDPDSDGIATCEDFDEPMPSPPGPDTDPCNALVCESASGVWSWQPDNTGGACDDGDNCTVTDLCTATGTCEGTVVDCSGSNDDCNTFACDPAGAVGNCSDVTYSPSGAACADGDGLNCTVGECDGGGACVPQSVSCASSAAHECDTRVCVEESAGCADIVDPLSIGMGCTNGAIAVNCVPECVAVPHVDPFLDAAGYESGDCQMGGALNDDCGDAISLGTFTDTSADQYAAEGSTLCATNRHRAGAAGSSAKCFEGGTGGNLLGTNSPDVVYSFTFTTTGGNVSRQRFVVRLEPDAGFDAAVYLSTGCDTASAPVAAEDCVFNGGADAHIQEDECRLPYECTKVGPATYDGDMASAVFFEPASAAPETLTIYVYVDGTQDISADMDDGDFFLSVTRMDDCPDPSYWYGGTIHQPGIAINGVDFPGWDPDNVQTSNAGTHVANGIVVSGSTATDGNNYTGEATDAVLDFSGNDELWELDPVTDGASVYASLCDFGGSVNTASVNPQIALFNCYGERVGWNDDGASCAGSPSGAEASSMEPTVTFVGAEGPYYLLVDARVDGSFGDSFDYDMALYYEPTSDETVLDCNPYDADSAIAASLPNAGNEPNVGSLIYYPAGGCVAGSFKDGCHVADFFTKTANQNIKMRSNAGLMGQCDNNGTNTYSVSESSWSSCWMTNNWSEQNCPASPVDARTLCFPIHLHVTAIVEHRDSGGSVLSTGYLNWELEQNKRGGDDADLIFPFKDLVDAEFDASISRDALHITALNFTVEHRRGLTEDQKALCEAKCKATTDFYIEIEQTDPDAGYSGVCNW